MRRFIDSHIHLDGFDDPEKVIGDARAAGVDALVCVGGSLESSEQALLYSEKFPDYVFPGLGVHPADILKEDLGAAYGFIREHVESAVAVGEIGLDYAYSFAKPKDVRARMRECYVLLLGVAAEAGLPVSIHSRSAYRDSVSLAVEAGVEGVFHWYDGPVHTLREILDAGFYVSATPAVEYSKGARAVMLETPLERILVETDSPVFLRSRDRLSSPVDVSIVVNALAELKGLDAGEVARVTALNAESLFKLP